jgi:glucose-1-phosphate thymidylyltransferase
MKGIILAGGSGTRLHPLTAAISKQLLPVFDKPMIFYPLSTLISMGIREVLVISSPSQLNFFKELLGDGKNFGVEISYAIQEKPNGIAEALIIGEKFINNDDCTLILGDNIFLSNNLNSSLTKSFKSGATIFTVEVDDPERYGVLEIRDNQPYRIIEKPQTFISKLAVTGLYFYDTEAVEICKSLKPSARGEIEISELNSKYLKNNALNVVNMDSTSIWMDAGTFDSLLDASNLICSMQNRKGSLLGSPELESLKQGFLSKESFIQNISPNIENNYHSRLRLIAEDI